MIMRTIGAAVGAQIAAAVISAHTPVGSLVPDEIGFTIAFALAAVCGFAGADPGVRDRPEAPPAAAPPARAQPRLNVPTRLPRARACSAICFAHLVRLGALLEVELGRQRIERERVAVRLARPRAGTGRRSRVLPNEFSPSRAPAGGLPSSRPSVRRRDREDGPVHVRPTRRVGVLDDQRELLGGAGDVRPRERRRGVARPRTCTASGSPRRRRTPSSSARSRAARRSGLASPSSPPPQPAMTTRSKKIHQRTTTRAYSRPMAVEPSEHITPAELRSRSTLLAYDVTPAGPPNPASSSRLGAVERAWMGGRSRNTSPPGSRFGSVALQWNTSFATRPPIRASAEHRANSAASRLQTAETAVRRGRP